MIPKIKLKAFALAAALVAFTGGVSAQDFRLGWDPRSGDIWVDDYLGDVNQYGSRYRGPFVDEMVRYYGAPRDLVTSLLVDQRWAPGDVYYACSIAQIIDRPCRHVVQEWERDHGQGWGVVAQRLGIKPGSAEFHRLKRGFVPTYDRWARPIRIDDDLRVHYPDRGKGPKGVYQAPGNEGKARAGGPGNRQGKDKQVKAGGPPQSRKNAGAGRGNATPDRGPGNNSKGGPGNKPAQAGGGKGNDRKGNDGKGNDGKGNSGKGKDGKGNNGKG
ncbi:MAG: hypothetical protein M3374_01020 [Pseudomonadota bacterium]|nr:hypothetical protein [Pseudomonadota bacterium]